MGLCSWLLRCIPGLSNILLLVFIECSLGILRTEWTIFLYPALGLSHGGNILLQSMFVCYSLVLHIAAFLFPVRLCWAVWLATKEIENAHSDESYNSISATEDGDRRHSLENQSGNTSDGEMTTDIIMAIIIPNYKEDICVLDDTLSVLASHKLAVKCYHVFLAMEERDPNGPQTAERLIETFQHRFMKIEFTLHPNNIPGEAPGKSSNVSWAAKEIERSYINHDSYRNTIITVMDSDTHLLSKYFEYINATHQGERNPETPLDMTLYVPPIIFDRNAHLVPRLVRMADLMWCGAGLSCFMDRPSVSGVAIPTAVYSLPLTLAHVVGGWDTGPNAIGEDMHMMLKCYFATQGRMRIDSVPSPASHCDVTSGMHGIRGWVADHRARYTQGLRHMWGSLDTGYALCRWSSMGEMAKTPRSNSNQDEKRGSPQRSRKPSFTEDSLKLDQLSLHQSVRYLTRRNMIVFARMFEAHFLPAHLIIVLIASALFTSLLPPNDEHWIIRSSLEITAYLRAISYASMVIYFLIFYDRYHRVCLQVREQEMIRAGLHAQVSDQFSHRKLTHLRYCVDCFVFPIAGTIFGSLPLLQATFSHFWTDKLVYLVSAKPIRLVPVGNTLEGDISNIEKLR